MPKESYVNVLVVRTGATQLSESPGPSACLSRPLTRGSSSSCHLASGQHHLPLPGPNFIQEYCLAKPAWLRHLSWLKSIICPVPTWTHTLPSSPWRPPRHGCHRCRGDPCPQRACAAGPRAGLIPTALLPVAHEALGKLSNLWAPLSLFVKWNTYVAWLSWGLEIIYIKDQIWQRSQ